MNSKVLPRILLILASAVISVASQAQESVEDNEIVSVEDVYNNAPATTVTPTRPGYEENQSLPVDTNKRKTEATQEVNDLKDLSRLAPFSEVSVIQKKFLPKTGRFQAFIGGSVMTNTPWYNNYGGKLHLAYHFTETLGLELNSSFLTNSESKSVKEIRDNNGLNAEQFVYTKSYYGLDLMWSPIYGKMTSLNDTVIPFDMYFSFGGGVSKTNSKEKDNSTFHVGVGQIFALSKAVAVRWDYSFTTFSATPASTNNGLAEASRYNDLLLTLGFSFFFPEASYR
ncbi:MAG: outer membrane beta-barrel domain-containing protein [Pseudobdellovibrio sp.]